MGCVIDTQLHDLFVVFLVISQNTVIAWIWIQCWSVQS